MTQALNPQPNITGTQMPSVLQRIVATKKQEVAVAKTKLSSNQIQKQAAKLTIAPRGFANHLRQTQLAGKIGIIAEIKKASPSKGVINHNFDAPTFAQQYEQAGATCLSVLTDEQYFQGHDDYLKQAKAACNLPILRKDFMIDEYQIYQSYLLGADCILLIMACLDDDTVYKLHQTSLKLGLDVLIETHTKDELKRALQLPQSNHNVYGINNRDLNTFEVNLQTTLTLKPILDTAFEPSHTSSSQSSSIQPPLLVTESGIHGSKDITLMQNNGVYHFLIGEQFMKTKHPGNALQTLLASNALKR